MTTLLPRRAAARAVVAALRPDQRPTPLQVLAALDAAEAVAGQGLDAAREAAARALAIGAPV